MNISDRKALVEESKQRDWVGALKLASGYKLVDGDIELYRNGYQFDKILNPTVEQAGKVDEIVPERL